MRAAAHSHRRPRADRPGASLDAFGQTRRRGHRDRLGARCGARRASRRTRSTRDSPSLARLFRERARSCMWEIVRHAAEAAGVGGGLRGPTRQRNSRADHRRSSRTALGGAPVTRACSRFTCMRPVREGGASSCRFAPATCSSTTSRVDAANNDTGTRHHVVLRPGWRRSRGAARRRAR